MEIPREKKFGVRGTGTLVKKVHRRGDFNDNKVYKVVWEVLQALRSHDDRFDAFINKVDLMQSTAGRMEVIAITDTLSPKSKGNTDKKGKGKFDLTNQPTEPKDKQLRMHFEVGELEKALYARLVQKCGNRLYWEEWASDIAKIAQTHIGRIHAILKNPKNAKEIEAFAGFANELRDDLNDSITDEEVIEMLAQHLITKPVFDALFAGYAFANSNPVSKGMQNILNLLNEHHLDKEADTLEKFYESVRRRAAGIDNAEGKQKIVVELYDKFFRNAFPRMTERLGIVYTPVEVVDFILYSVNDILQEEFGVTLGTKGVHILDPFVGTGTFITRLLQSGLITPEQMPNKYKHEIHANEIVLLAYYIAAINIEAVYHSIVGDKYQPFEGILLTDTFQMYESGDTLDAFFPDNSERRKRQKKLDIRVIVGNPPYSIGQEEESDGTKRTAYTELDKRIQATYVKESEAVLARGLYDSYIRSLRWASDRIGDCGVIGFVTNATFITSTTCDGLRKCLADEFDSIYVFHLRGNQRTSGDQSRREGGKIFGSGSRAPIAITLLTKNPRRTRREIQLYDIGDNMTREEKLNAIKGFGSIRGLSKAEKWITIQPDSRNDWINQRDESFDRYIAIGNKRSDELSIFELFSLGVVTARDAWCYNFSRETVSTSVDRLVKFYGSELERFNAAYTDIHTTKERAAKIDQFINTDPKKISWTRALKQDLAKNRPLEFNPKSVRTSLYRPFTKQWIYFNRRLNEMVYQVPRFFPTNETRNVVIGVSASKSRSVYSVFMTDSAPCLHSVDMVGSQFFPLFAYDAECKTESNHLFADDGNPEPAYAISDKGLHYFSAAYSGRVISKEDLFYYIYGLLHSPEYRERYKDNLGNELPRIPAVKKFEDFQKFAQAGRDLAHWHLNYETVKCHPVTLELSGGATKLSALKSEQFRVVKMKHRKRKDPETGKSVNEKSIVIYNEYITVKDIPLDAYDYIVNGKPAIDWVMERQTVTTDKDSGIVNDANLWATETMNNAAYPLELLLRVITVSLETNKIVNNLPKLEID